MTSILSILANAAICAVTFWILIRAFRKDGRWSLSKGLPTFRYFTALSNALCALASLGVCVAQCAGGLPFAVWLWKYIGTAAVTVTLLTVLLFLGPSMGGYKPLLSGASLFLHLICPLLAIASFSFLEKRQMSFALAMTGMLPVVLYGAVYWYRVIAAPEGERWPDFYGFNKGGRWPVTFTGMMIGGFLVCVLLWVLQNA